MSMSCSVVCPATTFTSLISSTRLSGGVSTWRKIRWYVPAGTSPENSPFESTFMTPWSAVCADKPGPDGARVTSCAVTLPEVCGAPVGLMTWPWILPVGTAGACPSTGTAANFIFFSLEQRERAARELEKSYVSCSHHAAPLAGPAMFGLHSCVRKRLRNCFL